MNQLVNTQDKMPMNSVGMASTGAGSKIAPQNLGEVVKFAQVMARADIALPKHLRGNEGACMAVALQALDWEMNPFAVASKSYQVNGTIAYEAQLIAAVVNTRSGIKGRLRYTYSGTGNEMTCTVSGTIDGEEYTYTSPPIGGITPKNSPLWKTDPQQQLGYFSARSWARRYTPEVILGVYDREEAEQFRGPDNARDITPTQPNVMDRLKAAQNAIENTQDEREGFSRDFVHAETESASTDLNHDFGDDEPTLELSPSDDADRPAASEEVEAGSIPASPAPASSSLINHLTDFARKGFRTLTDDDLSDDEKAASLEDMTGTYEGLIETGDIAHADWPKFESIVTAFKAVFAGKRTVQQGREFAAEVIGCKINQIGG